VSGYGTNNITINISKVGGTRTVVDLQNLVNGSGILTASAGYLVAANAVGTGLLVASSGTPVAASFLTGGAGPNSNTVFKVKNVPIVDGTNGGVVTTTTSDVTAYLNSIPVAVSAVDGLNGLVTLATPVPAGSQLTVTYYTNNYQNTYDLLPASNVASITMVGLGPDRSDYILDTDYVLGTDATGNGIINWGCSSSVSSGVATSGYTAFGPTQITTTLVDEKLYLQFVGTGDGTKTAFTLSDSPTDGSGLDKATDDPSKIQVYVGVDPNEAMISGVVSVAQLDGATGVATLYNPPQAGQNVYVTYNRNTLNDHAYTVSVVTPGATGQGTYTITDELGNVLPVVSVTSGPNEPVGNFTNTGIVWPNAISDLYAAPGAVPEIVTLTFIAGPTGGPTDLSQVPIPATVTTQGIRFTASTPGSAGDQVSIVFTSSTQGTPDGSAVTVAGDVVTIDINNGTSTRTIAHVISLFPSVATTDGGVILAASDGVTATSGQVVIASAVPLAGGVDLTANTYANCFMVTSSLATGGSEGIGYLGQTYIDAQTNLKFTIVDPYQALNYGYTIRPNGYYFAPGDKLYFTVAQTPRYTGSTYFPYGAAVPNNLIAIPGLYTKVVTTFGSNAGDTAIIDTFNKSGDEPNVGEFYYVSFTVAKTAADMAIKIYTNVADAYAAYGQPSTVNRLSLGIQLMNQNGAQVFGAIQVPQQTGMNTASDAAFIAALQTLTVALPGSAYKADIIIPLTTSLTVQQFLSRQLTTQATVRNKGEAIGFVGFNQFTTPTVARGYARSLKNARIMAIGTPVAGLEITDSQTGVAVEYAVSGEFMAAALAGLNANPSNDVATTLTNQELVGFTRLLTKYDDTTMNLMASDGLILLTDNNGALNIRHYKSTDPSNPITSEPTCTTVTDYVRQGFRAGLQQFIGRKLVDALVTDITTVCNSLLRSYVSNEIITGYKNLSVVQDPDDPTTVDVTVSFKPMFSLLYISVTFTVTTTL
jgi:hypothetical protein